MADPRFGGQTVLVTGGSGAIGAVVVRRFIEEGAVVVVADPLPPRDADVAALGAGAARLHHAAVDVTDERGMASAVRRAVALGGPQALVTVAGGFRFGPAVAEMDLSDWSAMFRLNLDSAFVAIKHALKPMREAGYGRIVSIAARSGLRGDPMVAHYGASKGGVILLIQSVAEEIKDVGDLTANAVLPSVVDTPGNREGMPDADHTRWVAPGDLAEVILFLASGEARAVRGAAVPVYHRA